MPVLLTATSWQAPKVDYHALAPLIVLTSVIVLMIVVDLFAGRDAKGALSSLAGIGLLATAVPLITLAVNGADRSMFGGAFVVDHFALVLDGVFVIAGYVVVLLSTNYIAEGDYWEGEYYILILSSVLGMMVMASARDLVTIFVALELLSVPAYMLAAWRKRDLRSNEAGLKYYLMGVFASGVMLYGMSLIYGFTGSTVLVEIGHQVNHLGSSKPIVSLAIVFMIIGFAFKVSAVPFHTWAPDTYEGAPTPVAAFLATASKTAGFVALMELIFVGFFGRHNIYEPLMWALAAASMTVGNLIALRQTNVVRMLAYSGIAQAGYIMAPLAVAGGSGPVGADAVRAVITYLAIYVVMNLGAFAVVIAVARKTRSRRADQLLGPVRVRARPGRGHAHLPGLAGRHPAHGRLVRQVPDLPHPGGAGHHLRVRAGRRGRRELGDRPLLLPAGDPLHVLRGGHRWRRQPHPGAGVADHRAWC